ncbi:MAG: AAA family ATPase [Polyangiales bacterium]
MSDAIDEVGAAIARVRAAVGEVIVGQRAVVDEVLLCMLAGGHCLLEGVPGLGKTLLVKALSAALSLRFARIQFTPDLMPADVTGTQVVSEDEHGRRRFELVRGPVFAQLVLADEINRATPRTQSALLEAMQEHQVTLAGARHALDEPFTVIATENPIEMEGTYPLPEAQLDRFLLKTVVPRPDTATMVEILTRTTGSERAMPAPVMSAAELISARALCRDVVIASPLVDWVARALRALDPSDSQCHERAKRQLRFGPGVRGGQSLVLASKAAALLAGRAQVSFEDLRRVTLPALRHRLILSFEGETDGATADAIVDEVIASVPEVAR